MGRGWDLRSHDIHDDDSRKQLKVKLFIIYFLRGLLMNFGQKAKSPETLLKTAVGWRLMSVLLLWITVNSQTTVSTGNVVRVTGWGLLSEAAIVWNRCSLIHQYHRLSGPLLANKSEVEIFFGKNSWNFERKKCNIFREMSVCQGKR